MLSYIGRSDGEHAKWWLQADQAVKSSGCDLLALPRF
jgi:hypothetical protein